MSTAAVTYTYTYTAVVDSSAWHTHSICISRTAVVGLGPIACLSHMHSMHCSKPSAKCKTGRKQMMSQKKMTKTLSTFFCNAVKVCDVLFEPTTSDRFWGLPIPRPGYWKDRFTSDDHGEYDLNLIFFFI